jgi:hypothetical protein
MEVSRASFHSGSVARSGESPGKRSLISGPERGHGDTVWTAIEKSDEEVHNRLGFSTGVAIHPEGSLC